MSEFARTGFELMSDALEEEKDRRRKRRKTAKNKKLWDLLGSAGSIAGMVAGGPLGLAIGIGSQLASNVGKGHTDETYIEDTEDRKFGKASLEEYKSQKGGYMDDLSSAAIDSAKYAVMQKYGSEGLRGLLGLDKGDKVNEAVQAAKGATANMMENASVPASATEQFLSKSLQERVGSNLLDEEMLAQQVEPLDLTEGLDELL